MEAEKKQNESMIVKEIFVWLYDNKIGKVHRVNVGAYKLPNNKWVRYGQKGHSDLLCELPDTPKNIYIEVKTPKGKATEEQKDFLKYQEARGHYCCIVHSLDEVIQFLKDKNII